jgi:hypothetical protein
MAIIPRKLSDFFFFTDKREKVLLSNKKIEVSGKILPERNAV